MPINFETILEQAKELNRDEQVMLANALYHGQVPVYHEAWLAETNRRLEAADRGEVDWVDMEEALKRIRAITRK